MKFQAYFLLTACLFGGSTLFASDPGNNSATLDAVLKNANEGIDTTISFSQSVSLTDQVRAVNANANFTYAGATITINGNNLNLNGSTTTRGFFVGGKPPVSFGSVTINDLNFLNCKAKGGDGGLNGGAGGLGAGGGLFVGENTIVTIKDCSFDTCSAKGGDGQSGAVFGGAAGGGGGMLGNGGNGFIPTSGQFAGGGGGAFGGNGATAGSTFGGGGGGASGFPAGDASGQTAGGNFNGGGSSGNDGNGGDGGNSASPPGVTGGHGGGGGGGFATPTANGGNGNFGSGGGGNGFSGPAIGASPGTAGGFGGGGTAGLEIGGAGGFGGGGGSANPLTTPTPGIGGFGGGDGPTLTPSLSGKGAGFGGAIFLAKGANLTIEGSVSFQNCSAAAADNGKSNTSAAEGFGALGQEIFMMSESSLVFNITGDPVTMPHAIEGNIGNQRPDPAANVDLGGLTKQGDALLTLTGDNTYSGTTTVEGGELRINSTVITPIIVNDGTTLSGNFTVKSSPITGSGNITNHGTIKPGVNGVGTILLEGIYEQTDTGILEVDITPDGTIHDKVLGATEAKLDGTLEVIVNPGNYISGTQYLIIDAPVGTTRFASIIEIGDLENLIELVPIYSSFILEVKTTRLFEDQKIDSGPPSDVVKCIRQNQDNIVPDSDFALMVEALGTLGNSAVNKALTSLSGVRFGALEWINARNNSYVADILSQHLFELCCSPRDCCYSDCNTSLWIAGFGNQMKNKKWYDNLRRFNADAIGGIIGMDWCCTPCFYLGGAFGYTHSYLLWKENGGRGHIDSFYGALYGSWHCDCMSVDFSALGGGTDNDLDRKIIFSFVDRTARSDFWNYFASGHLGLKFNWECDCSTFQPFVLVDYHYYTHDSFKEKGADSLNLRVKSKDQHMLRSEAGLKWWCDIDCDSYCVAPYFGASWVGEFPLHKSKQPASFVGQSCVIDATSYDSSVQLGSPTAGIKWSHCNGYSLLLGYKGLLNKKTQIHEIEGRLEWVF